jgi:hypothetical protein
VCIEPGHNLHTGFLRNLEGQFRVAAGFQEDSRRTASANRINQTGQLLGGWLGVAARRGQACSDDLETVAPGTVGELLVFGDQQAAGFRDQHDLFANPAVQLGQALDIGFRVGDIELPAGGVLPGQAVADVLYVADGESGVQPEVWIHCRVIALARRSAFVR